MENQTIINPTTAPLGTITPPIFQEPPKKHYPWLIAGAIIFFLIITSVFSGRFFWQRITQKAISNYDECVLAKGSMLQTMYPPVCVSQDGRQFIQYAPDAFVSLADDPTTNWKLYASLSNSYSFKYPDNLDVQLDKNNKDRHVFINPQGHEENPYIDYKSGTPYKKIQFTLLEETFGAPNDPYRTAKEFFDTMDTLPLNKIQPNGNETIKQFTIDNHKAILVNEQDTFGHALTTYHTTRAYILVSDKTLLSIGTVVFPEDKDQIDSRNETLDLILSTFRFTTVQNNKTTIQPTAIPISSGTQKLSPTPDPIIDTLEYLLTQHQEKTLSPTEYPQVYINQIIEKDKLYLMKWGPRSFLGYSWDDNYIYFGESHEADFDGAASTKSNYYFSPGIWIKRRMLIGEALDGSENGNILTMITRSDGPHSCNVKSTNRYFMKTILESRMPSLDMGGTLGKQDVIVLRIEQATYSEKEYYAKGWGLVEWQHCDLSGKTCDQTVQFNQVGTHTPRMIDKSGACLEQFK